jgi:hypothetical protein
MKRGKALNWSAIRSTMNAEPLIDFSESSSLRIHLIIRATPNAPDAAGNEPHERLREVMHILREHGWQVESSQLLTGGTSESPHVRTRGQSS